MSKKPKASKKDRNSNRLRKGELTSKDVYNTLHKNDVPDSIDNRVNRKHELTVGCSCYVDGFGFGKVSGFEDGIVYCTFAEFGKLPMGINEEAVHFAYSDGLKDQ